jgi:chemotaxis protein methyltransferase CheR
VKDQQCIAFLQWALPRMHMRWSGFRKVRGQVRKRLSRRLRELGLEGLSDYRGYLEAHPSEWTVLDSLCRITISRFYRDRAVFDALRETLLPILAESVRDRGDPAVRSWCAGCASGEEPYSLSLAWTLDASGRAPGIGLEIVATDVDARLLERARAACYLPGSLEELPSGWIAAAFDSGGEELRLRAAFQAPVRFLRQDVREEMPSGSFDLVLCRNLVFTYFEPSFQLLVAKRILGRLVPGGLLVLGGHETLPSGDWPLDRPLGGLPIYRLTDSAPVAEISPT